MGEISRRDFVKGCLAAAVAVGGAKGQGSPGPRGQSNKPNVLLIMADQHRKDAIGAYGNTVIKTPHLDLLASGGVKFENCWVQHAACMPSRACIFTGRYPMAHRVRSNGVPLPTTETTLAEIFARAGYRTGGAGKFHFIPHYPYRSPLPTMETHDGPYYGFQEFHLGEDGRSGEHWLWIKRNWPQYHLKPDHEIPLELHNSYWTASHVIDFIQRCAKKGEPFFAFCSFVDPHHSYNPPEPYSRMYRPEDVPKPVRKEGELDDKPPFLRQRAKREGLRRNAARDRSRYYGEVSFIDDSIGRVLQTLEQLGLRDRTLIVFVSDHGDMLGDHWLYFKGLAYRQSANVPLIFNWPGTIRSGKTIEGIVQEIDILPTILELVGLEVPAGVQGRSHAKLLRTDATDTGYEFAYIEHAGRDYTLRSSKWRFTYYPGKPYGELYDLEQDPDEFVNLWDDQRLAGVRQKLLAALLDRIVSTRDPLPVREKPY